MQCTNNLKQMGLGAMNHESATGCFPSGGWGYAWMGDPDCGFGVKQRAASSTTFCLHGNAAAARYSDRQDGEHDADADDATMDMCQTPITAYTCPTRRGASDIVVYYPCPRPYMNTSEPPTKGGWYHTDYAANGGDYWASWGHGPNSWTDTSSWTDQSKVTGITFQRSQVTIADIKDGTSNTYLVGEKCVTFDNYHGEMGKRVWRVTNYDVGDDGPALAGDDLDLTRWAAHPIRPCRTRPA